MKYSFKKINIEAPFPTTQCGHSCQTFDVDTYHDHLYARTTSFKTNDIWFIHYSMDVLAFNREQRDDLQDRLRKHFKNDNIHIVTSTTHTHYANSVRTDKYLNYLLDVLFNETINMEYKDVDNITTTYQRMHTTAVGKSRISGYETNNETLCLIRFYSNDNNFLNVVYNNCHPTILDAKTTNFFSSEYPGYVLSKLEEQYPNIDFTFLQGAAGDISSRFTRDDQTYNSIVTLGNKLVDEINSLININANKIPFKLEYKEVPLDYEHEFTPIDLSNLRQDLTDRELETIRLGQIQRQKLEEKANKIFGSLVKSIIITSLDIGSVQIIFYPNEIFSEYMNYLNLDKQMLVSYSNGYGPYILPIDFKYITYEMFTDTLTKKTKEKLIEILKTI